MTFHSARQFRLLTALVAGALVLSLAACSNDDPGLPSVGGTTQGSGGNDLEAVAKSFYTCLKDAGLPAEYGQSPDGRSTLVTFDQKIPVLWIARQSGGTTEAVSEEEANAFFEIAYKEFETATPGPDGVFDFDPQPSLKVNGVDQTEVWVKCLDSSGYDENKVYESIDYGPLMDAQYKATVEASNEWAKCARNNGYPNIVDAHMPQSENEWPQVLLPPSITEEQLRQLLAVCPNFDPAIEEANEKLDQDEAIATGRLPEGYKAQPEIGFDYPNFNGIYDETTYNETPDPATVQTIDRLTLLSEILYEAQMEYYNSAGVPPTTAVEAEPIG
jgi:hypothetical protein